MSTKQQKSYFAEMEKRIGRLTFGRMLRSWRVNDEMTQTAFAKRLGISVQNLNDLEHGRRIPSPTRAAKIAKKLGLPEQGLVALALRDSLWAEGLKYEVRLESA